MNKYNRYKIVNTNKKACTGIACVFRRSAVLRKEECVCRGGGCWGTPQSAEQPQDTCTLLALYLVVPYGL